jgi:hypothetical protein
LSSIQSAKRRGSPLASIIPVDGDLRSLSHRELDDRAGAGLVSGISRRGQSAEEQARRGVLRQTEIRLVAWISCSIRSGKQCGAFAVL